jgi:hypothetical protein
MTTQRVRLACLTVVLFLFSVIPALASTVRMVRLSLVQGDVQIDRNAGDGWEQAIVNMPVIGGARIYAAENSKAELEFEDGSSVRLAGPAQISVIGLSSASDGSPVNAIQVDSGVVYVNARLRKHGDFRISDNSGESFAITKPSHLRFTVNEQTASLAMNDGEATAQNASSDGTIRGGETYNYILGQPASAARLEDVPVQSEDAWNQQRDRYNEQNASAGAQYSGEDATAPGVADLGNYGSYSDIPGYGESWQPEGVGPDWSPFDNGAWCDYPDWGWTFVSGYPWGWAPFYYGNWFYLHGRGWWWHGGPHVGPGFGFHPRPLVAGAVPRGFNAPHPPTGVAHGTVAVAGSHLRVGPIGVTHASSGASGFASGGIASGGTARESRAATPTTARTAAPAGLHGNVPASLGAPSARSNYGPVSITGQKGTYSVSNRSTGRNGYEVHRPPASISTPHSYAYAGSSYAPRSYYSAPAGYSAPAASFQHAPSVPSVSAAPHVSSGGGGAVSHGGGISAGGGGGGAHGGGGGHR